MRAAWWNEYVGMPYAPHGRSSDGLDCWGLVCLVYRDQFGIALPEGTPDYDPQDGARVASIFAGPERDAWRPVTTPESGDVVLLRVLGYPSHIGLVTESGAMLHAKTGHAVVVERLDQGAWRHRIDGYYRHTARDTGVIVSGRPHPLRTVTLQTTVLEGRTLASIIDQECQRAGVPRAIVADQGHAWIEGEYIPAAEWATRVPAKGQRVEYRLLAAGENNGVLNAILKLIIVVIAIVLQQYEIIGPTLAAGIVVGGSILVDVIAPIRPPELPSSGGPGQGKKQLQGGANEITPYGAIPVVLGMVRFTPPAGAEPYVESSNDENFLRLAVVWGYGPLLVTDLRFGDTPVDSFDDVQIASLVGNAAQTAEAVAAFDALYGQDVTQDYVNIKLSTNTQIERTIGASVDFINVTLHFPTGMWKTPTEGGDAGIVTSVDFKCDILARTAGGGTWYEISARTFGGTAELPVSNDLIDAGVVYDLWQWHQVSIDKFGTTVFRHGTPTTDKDKDAFDIPGLLAILKAHNLADVFTRSDFWDGDPHDGSGGGGVGFNLDYLYTRIPRIGDGEVAIYQILVHEDAIVQTVDMRTAAQVTGCALTTSGTSVTVAAGDIAGRAGNTVSFTRETKDAFDIAVQFRVATGDYDVRVELKSPDEANGTTGEGHNLVYYRDCYYTTLTGIANNRPIVPPVKLAMTAMRIRASNQLNGVVDGLVGTVRSSCKDWESGTAARWQATAAVALNALRQPTVTNYFIYRVTTAGTTGGTEPTWPLVATQTVADGTVVWTCYDFITRPTSNPASLFRYVLQHPANAQPVADAGIDLAALKLWHQYCKTKGFSYNQVERQARPVLEVLRDIAAAGRASPTLLDGKWSVNVDQAKSTIVQHFTPHNSWGFAGARLLPLLPHALRIRFYNAAKAWQPDERIVYNDGYTSANATLFNQIDLPGVTSAAECFKHGRFHIAQMKLRPDRYTLNADAEHLIATRGDLVRVTHETALWGLGSGRITAIGVSGPNDINITVDEAWPMKASGAAYTVRVRRNTGASLTIALNNPGSDGDYSQVTFTTPLTSGSLTVGDLCLFGETGAESVELLVTSIEPDAAGNARLTFVDYAPAVYDAESEAIPEFDSQITLPPTLMRRNPASRHLPVITSLLANEAACERSATGNIVCGLRIAWRNPRGLPPAITHVEVQHARDATRLTWRTHPPLTKQTRGIWIGPLTEQAKIIARLRYVTNRGLTGPWVTTAPTTITGRSNPPFTPTGLTAVFSDSLGLTLQWDDNDDIDLASYELRSLPEASVAWDYATVVRRVIRHSEWRIGFIPATPSIFYMVKARDTRGNMSAGAVGLLVNIAPPTVSGFTGRARQLTVTLSWTNVQTTFPVVMAEVRKGTSWASGTLVATTQGSTLVIPETQRGMYTYRLKTLDAAGNYSAEHTFNLFVPGILGLTSVQTTFNGALT